MHVFEVTFTPNAGVPAEEAEETLELLLGAWRGNGQILGLEFPTAHLQDGYRAFVRTPATDALDDGYDNIYAQQRRTHASGLGALDIRLLGPETISVSVCPGHPASDLILYTDYVSAESPLRCAECFGTVPLYTLPPRHDQEHLDIVSWQGDYRACDRLQMGCVTGEAFALNEMENPESSLSRRGRQICERIQETTGRRAWYYLYRYRGVDEDSELARLCPRCGGEWRLAAGWHQLFDFRCDRCGLLSNIAPTLGKDDDIGPADANGGGAA